MTDSAALFADRADSFATLLDSADQYWDAPTPCADWTVRDIVRHAIETEQDFLGRHDLPVTAVDVASDPAAAWQSHAAAVTAVLAQDGVAGRAFDGYFGPTTIGETMADFYGWDLAVHAWDVARATGQEWPVTDVEADALSRTADGWGPALYSEGICAQALEVSADASSRDRLLARLGRDPRWRP